MIRAAKALVKRHWPRLRLRTILLAVLLFAAAMPAVGTVFLRVYENTLVRQTEVELVAQGAALAAAAGALWPGAPEPTPADRRAPGYYRPEPTAVDLRGGRVLPERPRAAPARTSADPDAVEAVRRLNPIIDRTTRTTLASVLVLDRNGRVLRGLGAGGSLAGLPEVRQALAGRPATVMRDNADYRPTYSFEWLSRASSLRLHHARPITVGNRVVGVLLLSRSPRALFRGMYEDRGKLLLGLGVILGTLVVLSGLVSRGVTRPIEALSRASREVADGRGAVPETPPTAAVEIQALYEDFRAMAAAIERRSRYLRDFAAAVSHEFKTPLAGIGGAVELLQDHGANMSPTERARFLDAIAAGNERLNHLVSRLLELARADMAAPEAGARTSVATVAWRVADALAAPGFAIEPDLPGGLPPIAMPEAALESVLAVLFENARQAGATRAGMAAAVQDGVVALTVFDDGPGIGEADRERLFEPFFTTRRDTGGTGLGLPIARSLLSASHGSIEIVDSDAGARFMLTLPLAREA